MQQKSGETDAQLRLLHFSPAARYALQGMRHLAKTWGQGQFHLADDSAKAEGLPSNFLSKIFQKLARRELLISRRGPGGGYALAKPPAEIPIADILLAIEEKAPLKRSCLLNGGACSATEPCALHEKVTQAEGVLVQALESVTLANLL